MKNNLDLWYDAVAAALSTLLEQFAAFIPSFLAATVILVIGYIVAKLVKVSVSALLKKAELKQLVDSTGINEQLGRFGNKTTASSIISSMFFWIIMLLFVVTAADSLSLAQLSNTIDRFILFVPKIIAAIFIGIFGLVIANLFKAVVYDSAKAAGFDFAEPASKVAFAIIVTITVSLAISQLEIDTKLLNYVVSIAIASLGLGAALSLGLGSKNASEQIIYSVYIADLVKVGDKVTLSNGTQGVVKEIGAVATKIAITDSESLIINNKDFVNLLKITDQ